MYREKLSWYSYFPRAPLYKNSLIFHLWMNRRKNFRRKMMIHCLIFRRNFNSFLKQSPLLNDLHNKFYRRFTNNFNFNEKRDFKWLLWKYCSNNYENSLKEKERFLHFFYVMWRNNCKLAMSVYCHTRIIDLENKYLMESCLRL